MRTRQIISWGVVLVLCSARFASAGLGIPLDGFLQNFQLFIVSLGTLIFLLGLGSYVYQWISVPHSPLLGNSLTMMVLGGLFGGGTTIATALGLFTSGAILP